MAPIDVASIYSKSAPSRLAGPRYTVNQLRAGLHGPVEHFASLKQACMASSKSSPASCRLAGPRRSLRQRHAGLHGPVEVFASLKQVCMASSKSSPASSRLAWPCRSLRQRQTGMALVSRGAIGEQSVVGARRRIVRRNLSLSTLQTKEETDL